MIRERLLAKSTEAPDTVSDGQAVFVQLLDEIERDEAERQRPTPRQQPAVSPAPQPFAHD